MTVDLLRAAMSPTYVSDAVLTEYLPHFSEAMRAANINTVRRAAAWCSQLGHESGGLRLMLEGKPNGAVWDANRERYKGRGPIQLTHLENYRAFGIWCKAQGYVTDSEMFVSNPALVEQPKWGFLASSWYWLNGGPRPGRINEYADQGDILAVSRCVNGWVDGKVPNGFDDRRKRWDRCLAIGDRLLELTTSTTQPVEVDPMRPDFNEFAIWSANNSSRNGTKPRLFCLHTQEGGGGNAAAENLAKWFQTGNSVSYHYTVSQASDGGVTVVDCVDTDHAAWSVGNANAYTINLCFAGSRASWTRAEWLKQSNAIDVAAYLAVQDAKKYGFPTDVAPYPYTGKTPAFKGITDHRFITDVIKWGSHTDVGTNFPWDVFSAAVKKYAEGVTTPPVVTEPEPPKVKRFPEDWSDRDLLIEIVRQLRGYNLNGWPQLGGKTLVDAVAELLPDSDA